MTRREYNLEKYGILTDIDLSNPEIRAMLIEEDWNGNIRDWPMSRTSKRVREEARQRMMGKVDR